MRKTDKKIEAAIVQSLTQVCDQALDSIEGFSWLTHQVNYKDFPRSLNITCVFDCDEALRKALQGSDAELLTDMISAALGRIDISLDKKTACISFASEESGQNFARR